VSLVVRGGHGHARAASAGVPPLGHDVSVRVGLRHGEAELEGVSDHGEDNGTVELEGVVQSVDVTGRTLTLSADDEDESGGTVTVLLPDSFDPSSFQVGDEVEFIAILNPDGTYTAVSSSDEDNAEEADDPSDDQGEDADDDSGEDQAGDNEPGESNEPVDSGESDSGDAGSVDD
jgi:hypothetical protein